MLPLRWSYHAGMGQEQYRRTELLRVSVGVFYSHLTVIFLGTRPVASNTPSVLADYSSYLTRTGGQ